MVKQIHKQPGFPDMYMYLGKQDKTVCWLVIGHLLEDIYLEQCYVREDGKVNGGWYQVNMKEWAQGRPEGAGKTKCKDRVKLSMFREEPKKVPVTWVWEGERTEDREKHPHRNPGNSHCHAPRTSHPSSIPHQHHAEFWTGWLSHSHCFETACSSVYEQTVPVKGEAWYQTRAWNTAMFRLPRRRAGCQAKVTPGMVLEE